MQEEQNELVTLVDDEGHEVVFEHILTLEYKGSEYAMVVPVEGLEDEDESLVALRIVPGGDGEDDCYEGVVDEKLLAVLYEKYLEQVEFIDE